MKVIIVPTLVFLLYTFISAERAKTLEKQKDAIEITRAEFNTLKKKGTSNLVCRILCVYLSHNRRLPPSLYVLIFLESTHITNQCISSASEVRFVSTRSPVA